jgi:hypothetical protein
MHRIHRILDSFVELLPSRLGKATICVSLYAVHKLTPSSSKHVNNTFKELYCTCIINIIIFTYIKTEIDGQFFAEPKNIADAFANYFKSNFNTLT